MPKQRSIKDFEFSRSGKLLRNFQKIIRSSILRIKITIIRIISFNLINIAFACVLSPHYRLRILWMVPSFFGLWLSSTQSSKSEEENVEHWEFGKIRVWIFVGQIAPFSSVPTTLLEVTVLKNDFELVYLVYYIWWS